MRRALFAAHDVVRETVRDPDVADEMWSAVDAYGRDETARAPDSGDQRRSRLADLGRLQQVVLTAQRNAAGREADGAEAVEGAEAAVDERCGQAGLARVTWVALDRFGTDAAVRDEVRGEPFVDGAGDLKDDLSEREANAFREWLSNQSRDGGLADDVGDLEAGSADISASPLGVALESRR